MWTAGYLLGNNKFTSTVKHRNVFICVDDHDIGPLIPDITIPPVNAYYAIGWPFSSRKMTFKCTTVKMNDKPTSCSQSIPIPMPMMTCGDPVTAPTAIPLINYWNGVTVGLSLADFLMGVLMACVSMAVDLIFEWDKLKKFLGKIGDKIGGQIVKIGGRHLATARRAANALIDKYGDKVGWTAFAITTEAMKKLGLHPGTWAKKAVGSLAGWGTSAYAGNPTLAVKFGGGIVPQLGVQAGGNATGGTVGGIPVGGTAENILWYNRSGQEAE